MKNMISFIIPVRDRDNIRIQNCVDSLISEITEEIIIVDYGSKEPIKDIKNARIIRYDKNEIWNKPHAINIGIKVAKSEYISSVDCDMIVSPDFIGEARKHLNGNEFIYSINVKRVNWADVSKDFDEMLKKSFPWSADANGRHSIVHNANGGIQIYPKKWISDIGGTDESLVYWGGMDNDVFERAILSGLVVINLNKPILHQEHEFKKEENLPVVDRARALRLRMHRMKYLEEMMMNGNFIRNNGHWGEDTPNQDKFLEIEKKLIEEEKRIESMKKSYNDAFVKAIKAGKKGFNFNGEEIKIFVSERNTEIKKQKLEKSLQKSKERYEKAFLRAAKSGRKSFIFEGNKIEVSR
jgi:glycosyltransferase involved in cell wall biosynthesis